MTSDPQVSQRDKPKSVGDPVIGHPRLRRESPGEMPRAFAAQGEKGDVLSYVNF